MWVINQDGIAVVQVQGLALDPTEVMNEEKRKNGVRIWGSISDHDYIMGIYPTVEDAMQVLALFSIAVSQCENTFTMPKAKNDKEVA